MNPLSALQAAARLLPAHRYAVDRPVDERGQYQRQLAPEFPFEISRLQFPHQQPPRPLTWHTYLEIFVLLSSRCRRQMGDTTLDLMAGDTVVMDHLKLHAIVNFPAVEAEAIIIRFLPEIVRSAAHTTSDLLLLLPFYCHIDGQPHVVRQTDPVAANVHLVLGQLLEDYAGRERSPYGEAATRVRFLTLLTTLSRHFQAAERLLPLYPGQQARMGRLQKVFRYIDEHYASPIPLPQMAALAGLSPQQFHTVFKKASGTSLVSYITEVRLSRAVRLLQESDLTVAEIAQAVGFTDQSYFARRFRQRFDRNPQQFRRAAADAGTS